VSFQTQLIIHYQILNNAFEHNTHSERNKVLNSIYRRIKAHYYIFGTIKERCDVENKYIINLEAMVAHKNLSNFQKAILDLDIKNIFPKIITIDERQEVSGFKLTSDHIFIASGYIIGLAAFLSNDPNISYKIHSSVLKEINQIADESSKINKLNIRDIKLRLINLICSELFRQAVIIAPVESEHFLS